MSHVTETSPLFSEYDYLEGTVFLRLSHKLTPKQAKVYERAFRRACLTPHVTARRRPVVRFRGSAGRSWPGA